jgi:predicted metal-dependent phosphoesterase TrpH
MTYLQRVRRFDMHLHSSRSDGRHAPEDVLIRCAKGGLDVVALTDHDLSTSLPTGEVRIGDRALHVIGGAEVSGVHEGREYHLLVYFPEEIPACFASFCADRARARATRYADAVERLNLPGLHLPDEAAFAGERSLTRHHLARDLIKAGHANDLRDAFRRYADTSHGYVRNVELSFTDAINIAKTCGGLTAWAHPPMAAMQAHLEEFVEHGLDAVEGWRPSLTSSERRRLRDLAKRYNLLISGGSDWHGWAGDGEPGMFAVDMEQLRPFIEALVA